MRMQPPTGKKAEMAVPEAGKGKMVFGKGHKAETAEEMNERLIRWLNSPAEKMPYLAIGEMHGAGRECMPAALEALSHSDHSIRANAALILSKIGDRGALRCLKMALSDRSPAVCAVAEMAVFEIVKRHLGEFDAKSVEGIAARLGGRYGRALDRLLGKNVREPGPGEDEKDF